MTAEIIGKIMAAAHIDLMNKTPFELFTNIAAELGELAQALSIEHQSFGSLHRPPPSEPAMSEACDVAIAALGMAVFLGARPDQIEEIMLAKLDKWLESQKANLKIQDENWVKLPDK